MGLEAASRTFNGMLSIWSVERCPRVMQTPDGAKISTRKRGIEGMLMAFPAVEDRFFRTPCRRFHQQRILKEGERGPTAGFPLRQSGAGTCPLEGSALPLTPSQRWSAFRWARAGANGARGAPVEEITGCMADDPFVLSARDKWTGDDHLSASDAACRSSRVRE